MKMKKYPRLVAVAMMAVIIALILAGGAIWGQTGVLIGELVAIALLAVVWAVAWAYLR